MSGLEIITQASEGISNVDFDFVINHIKGIGLVAITAVATLYVTKIFAKRNYAMSSKEETEEASRKSEGYGIISN